MFNNLIEVTQFFSDKQRCIDYLAEIRWNGNVTCPYCSHEKVYKLNGADKRWKCAKCRKPFSAIKGTIFENSPVPLQKWFVALYLMGAHKKGISSVQLSKDISVTQKTAWFMLQRIRFALQTKSLTAPIMATTIECDETYIGGKNKNRHKDKKVPHSSGRAAIDKTPVFGLVERNGRVVAMKVSSVSGKVLQPIISQYVAKGSIVHTDEWNGYVGLGNNFQHSFVRHNSGEYKVGDCHTNTIENFWS